MFKKEAHQQMATVMEWCVLRKYLLQNENVKLALVWVWHFYLYFPLILSYDTNVDTIK